MYEDVCPYCGKEGLKREHGGLYEVNGWLHCCGTTPSHRSVNYLGGNQLNTNFDFDESLDFIDLNREVGYVGKSHYND